MRAASEPPGPHRRRAGHCRLSCDVAAGTRQEPLMCTGRTHALSGAVAGSALSIAALHASRPTVALAALVTAGAAVLPDVDHPDSTVAHTFGLVTQAFAWIVGRLSGGHRHLTHSLSGVAVFTGLAFLAGAFRHTWPGRIGLGAAAHPAVRVGAAGAQTRRARRRPARGRRGGGHGVDRLRAHADPVRGRRRLLSPYRGRHVHRLGLPRARAVLAAGLPAASGAVRVHHRHARRRP